MDWKSIAVCGEFDQDPFHHAAEQYNYGRYVDRNLSGGIRRRYSCLADFSCDYFKLHFSPI